MYLIIGDIVILYNIYFDRIILQNREIEKT